MGVQFKNTTLWLLSGEWKTSARLEEGRPVRRPEQWSRAEMMGVGPRWRSKYKDMDKFVRIYRRWF